MVILFVTVLRFMWLFFFSFHNVRATQCVRPAVGCKGSKDLKFYSPNQFCVHKLEISELELILALILCTVPFL